MPPLPNQRHEKYCQALFEGQPQNAAYEAAGYRYHEGNASRLRSNEKVIARLAELQAAAAKASEVTVESLLAELEHARGRADSLDQLSAAVKATAEKAKIAGLLTQRVELTTSINDRFDEAESIEDIAKAIAFAHKGIELTGEELKGLVVVYQRCCDAIDEYLAGCVAKPVQPARDLASIERKRLGLRQIGNGQR